MGVWRKWVFPILRLTIFTIIAVALIKLAFFPSAEAEATGPNPTGSAEEQIVTAELGSITNEVVLDATVVADAAVPARATLAGEVAQIHVAQGATVEAGAPIITIRQEIEQQPIQGVDRDGNPTSVTPRPKYKTAQVTASASGVVSSMPMVEGQQLAIGDTVAQVAPSTFSVTGNIQPSQQFRLEEQPTEAQVAVQGGPDAFTCTGLTITAPLAGAGDGDGATPPSAGSGPVVSCAVPAGVRVFPGLSGKMTLPGGSVENTIILPTTAVRGSSQSGTVWLPAEEEGGAPVERAVTLGMNDGSHVQIVEGLAEGESVLQFIPTPDPTNVGGEQCIQQPDGSEYCEENPV